jgi:hypothetical protein
MHDDKKLVQVGLTGPNKTGIMGYHTMEVTESGGLAFVGNDVLVQMAVSINGTNYGFQVKPNIPMEIFQQLMKGNHGATVQLVQFETEKNRKIARDVPPVNEPKPAKRERPKDLSDSFYEPKRKSAFNSKLGTSGKKKYYQDADGDKEVSWVDIVELAHKHCGPQTKLQTLYNWAEKNVYTFIGDQKCSVSALNNWEASIRQNRRKTASYAGPSNTPEKSKFIIDEQTAYSNCDLNAELAGLPEGLIDGLDSPVSVNEDKVEAQEFSVEDYTNSLADQLKMSAENFERTKIPMRSRDGAKQPMNLPCVIPNPYEEKESELQYDFIYSV